MTEICSEGGSDPTRTVRYVTPYGHTVILEMQSFKKQVGVFPGEYLLVDDFSLKGNFLRHEDFNKYMIKDLQGNFF